MLDVGHLTQTKVETVDAKRQQVVEKRKGGQEPFYLQNLARRACLGQS